jgi:hypothetical protein
VSKKKVFWSAGLLRFLKKRVLGFFIRMAELICKCGPYAVPQFILKRILYSSFYNRYKPFIAVALSSRSLNYHL